MQSNHRLGAAPLLLALALLGSVLTIPPTKALNSDWTQVVIPGITGIATQMQVANQGETLGIAYRLFSTSRIGFSTSSTPTVAASWVQKTIDVSGSGLAMQPIKLLAPAANTWTLLAWQDTAQKTAIYHSTDNGATWTATFTSTATCAVCQLSDFDETAGPNSATILAFTLDGLELSTDGGTTWTSQNTGSLCDNAGAPGQSGTSSNACGASGTSGSLGYHNGHYEWYWNRGAVPNQGYYSAASANGASWTVGYYSTGTCPPGYQNLGTITCRFVTSGAGFSDDSTGMATNPGSPYAFRVLFNGFAGTPYSLITTDAPVAANAVAGTNAEQIITESCTIYGSVHRAVAMSGANKFMEPFGNCSSNGLIVRLKVGVAGTWATSFSGYAGMVPKDVAPIFTSTKAFVFYTNSNSGDQLEMIWSVAPSPSVADADVAVTNLTGFDVDDSGVTVIARHNAGTIVQVYSGQSLSAGASATDADCSGKEDGVSTYTTTTDVYTTYFECSNAAGNPANSLKIRNGGLGTPFIPEPCQSDNLGADTTTGLDVNVPDTMREIAGLSAFPLDFSACSSSGLDHVTLSWGFSTTNGQIGVFAVTKNHDAPDHSSSAFITFDPTSTNVAQMCSWTSADGIDHIGAVDPQGGTKFYLPSVTTTGTSISGGLGTRPHSSISLEYGLSGTFNLAKALSCAQYRAAIINNPPASTANSFAVICIVTGHCPMGISRGQALWTPKTIAGSVNARAATLSGDGHWTSYIDQGGIHILNATTGSEVALFGEPETGIFFDMRMDRSGSNEWIAYRDHIYRFDIHAYTCGGNCTNIPIINPTPTTSSSSTFSCSSGTLICPQASAGISQEGMSWFLGILLIAALSVGLAVFAPWVGVLGGGLGFSLAIGLHLIPMWVAILIFAGCMAVLALIFTRR